MCTLNRRFEKVNLNFIRKKKHGRNKEMKYHGLVIRRGGRYVAAIMRLHLLPYVVDALVGCVRHTTKQISADFG